MYPQSPVPMRAHVDTWSRLNYGVSDGADRLRSDQDLEPRDRRGGLEEIHRLQANLGSGVDVDLDVVHEDGLGRRNAGFGDREVVDPAVGLANAHKSGV